MNQTSWISDARRNALWIFAIASLLTVILGAVVMAQGGVPLGIWIRNPIAWLVAGAVAILLASRGWLGGWAVPVAFVVITLTFLGPEQEGVHRWLGLGPIQLNGAALVASLAIVTFERANRIMAAISFLLIAALLAWQPDISQLAGFALAAIVLGAARFGWAGAGISILAAAIAIATCLTRPDPLEPVAHVEGVFALAWSQSPIIAIAMGLGLGAAALVPLIIWLTNPRGMTTALALATYFAATALAPIIGAYPVPLAGYGLSFVIGWWLALGSLCIQPAPDSRPAASPGSGVAGPANRS